MAGIIGKEIDMAVIEITNDKVNHPAKIGKNLLENSLLSGVLHACGGKGRVPFVAFC